MPRDACRIPPYVAHSEDGLDPTRLALGPTYAPHPRHTRSSPGRDEAPTGSAPVGGTARIERERKTRRNEYPTARQPKPPSRLSRPNRSWYQDSPTEVAN